ncbi:MAG: ATP-binding protein [Candidatus Thorarchaeota archaeon]
MGVKKERYRDSKEALASDMRNHHEADSIPFYVHPDLTPFRMVNDTPIFFEGWTVFPFQSQSINNCEPTSIYIQRSSTTQPIYQNRDVITSIVKKYVNAHKPVTKIFEPEEDEEDTATTNETGELVSRNDFLLRVIESLTHPFYVIDVNDYTIRIANSAAKIGPLNEKTFCYSAIHRSSVPCWKRGQSCPVAAVKKTKKPVMIEHMHFDDKGDLREIEVYAYPIFDANGEVTLMIKYGLDITEQKWAETQLEKESRRARLYLDLLAHDMANELQVIQGSAELARDVLPMKNESDMIPQFVSQILDSVNRCMGLIMEARSTENLAIVPLVERSLSRALLDCVAIVGEKFCDCVIELEGEDSESLVMADRYLENLFTHLLTNAIKHNPSPRKIVWTKLHSINDGFEISIADNGPGIEDVMKEILFDLKHRFGGLGIQFSLQIVEKYGGKLSVRDRVHGKPNEGVEFIVWLPKIRSVEN